jgi:ATP-binding cassette subfamily B protein
MENFRYVKKDVTLKEVRKVCKKAFIDEYIMSLPNGYNTIIGEGGVNLSGGQKQRLSIARAIARDPEIYIFDDSFSALDYKTDLKLRKELNKYTKNTTKFIVANRIGTIKDSDKILVLDNGLLVGIGTHKELLKSCKVYKEIAESQLSEEELKNA